MPFTRSFPKLSLLRFFPVPKIVFSSDRLTSDSSHDYNHLNRFLEKSVARVVWNTLYNER